MISRRSARTPLAAALVALAALALGALPAAPQATPLLAATALQPLRGAGADARGADVTGPWLRVESAGPGAMLGIGNAAPLDPPLDLRDRFVSLRVRVDHAERLTGAELALSSREGAFLIPVTVFADEPMNLLQSGQWLDLTLGFGAARSVGTPDRAAIERVEWRLSERAEPGPPLVGWVGGLSARPLPPAGVVSLTFDDGYDDHYAIAAPMLAEHGFRGTAYVMPDQIGLPGYLTLEQLHALERDFHWDVAAHHFTPFTDFPPAELPGILDGIQGYLAAQGLGAGRLHLAYPLGKHDARILALVRARFATARLASGGAETLPPADPLRLRAYNVLATTPPAAIAAAARRARDEREWLILMFHYLVDAPQRDTEYPIGALREALVGISDSGVAVRPVSEVWRDQGGASPAR